jgi:hypothetical protein
MRDDMAKVIVERPRLNRGARYPKGERRSRQRLEMDEWHRRQGIRRPWLRNPKCLNENLAPLRRFLLKQCGRPWNKVFAEMSERIDLGSTVQRHIWQHVEMDVCRDVSQVKPVVRDRRGLAVHSPFFVHPRTGLLLRNNRPTKREWREAHQQELPTDRREADAGHEYRRIDGIWYELELAPLPAEEQRGGVRDALFLKPVAALNPHQEYGRAVYTVRKRQIGKRRLRELKLDLLD